MGTLPDEPPGKRAVLVPLRSTIGSWMINARMDPLRRGAILYHAIVFPPLASNCELQ